MNILQKICCNLFVETPLESNKLLSINKIMESWIYEKYFLSNLLFPYWSKYDVIDQYRINESLKWLFILNFICFYFTEFLDFI